MTRASASSRGLLPLLCLTQFVLTMDFAIAQLALPEIRDTFDARTTDLHWVTSAYALAHRHAVDGVEQPVLHRGEVVGSVRECSDALLMFLLRGRRPDRYGTSRARVEMSGSAGPTYRELETIRRAGVDPELSAALTLIAEKVRRAAA
jgi:hypothetical protein